MGTNNKPAAGTGDGTIENQNQPETNDAAPPCQDWNQGWFKARHNPPEAAELWKKHRPAFFLLYMIADRARYYDGFNAHGLKLGQAFIGKMDMESRGITEQEYRTAKRVLQDGGFATFKPTKRGTIATLINTSIFDPFPAQGNEPSNELPTNCQRTANELPTPNNKDKKGTKIKMGIRRERSLSRENCVSSSEQENPQDKALSPNDPPKWLPQSAEAAKEFAEVVGCPPDYAEHIWYIIASRGWKNSKGQAVMDFKSYLIMCWKYDEEEHGPTGFGTKRRSFFHPNPD